MGVRQYLAVAALFIAGAAKSFSPGFGSFAASITVLAALILALMMVSKAILRAIRANWIEAGRHAFRAFILLIATLTAMLAGDFIHLAVCYPYYSSVIGSRSEVVRFPWGVYETPTYFGPFGVPPEIVNLVYDPTGETAKHLGPGEELYTRHLIGPFFVENRG
jgi:hypothetical protein